jgi:glycerol-3-phosphate dehydrogenase
MAKDVIDQAAAMANLKRVKSRTKKLKIHGHALNQPDDYPLNVYGSDSVEIRAIVEKDHTMGELIHPDLPYIKAQVVWAARQEMARTVEDVLARRTRSLLLDAAASVACSATVARLLAIELNRNDDWITQQVESYGRLAKRYLVHQ